MWNLEQEYELAFNYLLDELVASEPFVDKSDVIDVLKSSSSAFNETTSYLDGWVAAKAYGLDNDTKKWLARKLKSL